MTRKGRVTLRLDGPIARLVIDNQSKRNALDLAMIGQMGALLARLARHREVRVLVVSGAGGKAFSAGADLDALTESGDYSRRLRMVERALERVAQRLARLPVPTIAALSGYCMGGGVQIALACDMRVAAGDLLIGIPAIRMGLVYPRTAIAKLARLSGTSGAKLFLLTGRPFDAASALAMGLVDAVMPARGFRRALDELAHTIARQPPGAARAYKRVIDALAADDLAAAERIARRINRGREMYAALARVRAERTA